MLVSWSIIFCNFVFCCSQIKVVECSPLCLRSRNFDSSCFSLISSCNSAQRCFRVWVSSKRSVKTTLNIYVIYFHICESIFYRRLFVFKLYFSKKILNNVRLNEFNQFQNFVSENNHCVQFTFDISSSAKLGSPIISQFVPWSSLVHFLKF